MPKIFNPLSVAPVSYTLLTEDDTVTGGRGNDYFVGNSINNSLGGLSGDDTLLGEGGDDTLHGGEGADSMLGGIGNDVFIVDNVGDKVSGGSGTDKVFASVSYTLAADVENIELTGSSNINATGNALNNLIIGNLGNNSLAGGDGNDSLLGLEGSDTLNGGTGNDSLDGGEGNDSLDGGTGNDILRGGSGVDTLRGGAGNDTYYIDNAADLIIEDVSGGVDTVIITSSSVTLSGWSNIEHIIPYTIDGGSSINTLGSAGNDSLYGNDLANSLSGFGGADTLDAKGGNDTLDGGEGNDSLDGGEGNDMLIGGAGADTLRGGAGNDTYYINNLEDTIIEGSSGGSDTIITTNSNILLSNFSNIENIIYNTIDGGGGGSNSTLGTAGDDSLFGNDSANTLSGLGGSDTLDAKGGNDRLDGGASSDSMIGGAGNDIYVVDDESDEIIEEEDAGNDLVESSINYTLGENLERLTLTGAAIEGAGNDLDNTLTGNSLGNSLDGGAGVDRLIGGAGNDTYIIDDEGDVVVESLNGGLADTVFSTVAHTLSANVENLIYTGAANVSLSGNSANNLIDGTKSGRNTLVGGAGNDTFVVNAARIGTIVESSVTGGTDTIRLVGSNATLNNAALNNIEAYDLSLTGKAAVTLAGNATSLQRLIGSKGADTLRALGSIGFATLNAGDGADRFIFNNKTHMTSASLVGGAGTDTLAFIEAATGSNTLGDSNFARVSGVEFHSLSGSGNGVVLGTRAQKAGISTVRGGLDNDTINASAYTVGITIDVCRNTNVEGAPNSENTVIGGQADDLIIFSNHNVAAASSVVGGEGEDTLVFAENGISITDDKFDANISEIEVLKTKDGTNHIQIGSLAGESGVGTLIGGSGSDTFDAAEFDHDIFIDAGAGVDSITLKNANRAGSSTVIGGDGDNDTLAIAEAGSLSDDQLENISGIEVLQSADTGASAITIGEFAEAIGVRQVIGGNDNDTIDARLFQGSVTLKGGDGNDQFVVATGDKLRQQIVQGGEGIDTVSLAIDQLSVTDADFSLASSVEVLRTANGNNRVVLGANAQKAGIATIQGGSGRDTLSAVGYAATSGVMFLNPGAMDSLVGGAGIDSILSGSNFNMSLASAVEFLELTGLATLGTGNSLNNRIVGNSVNNTLVGGYGNDTLEGKGGVDTLSGESGNDVYVVDTTTDRIEDASGTADMVRSSVSFDLSNTLVAGGSGVEHLTYTGSSAATLTGSSLNNSLLGNDQNNTLEGKGGVDTLSGGSGSDVYVVDTITDLIEDASGTADMVRSSVSFDLSHTLVGGGNAVENLAYIGSSAATLTGNSLNNSLVGAANSQTLVGGFGNDTLDGAAGADSLAGGAGEDVYVVDSLADDISESEGQGNDLVIAKVSGYSLGANVERLSLDTGIVSGIGNTLANTLLGNAVANSLNGGSGIDSLLGGAGNDTYFVDNASDVVVENSGEGTEDLVVSSASYTLGANIEKLTLTGTAVSGSGNAFANTITGNASNNSLDGGAGIDSMVGGAGNDTYFVENSGDKIFEIASLGADLALVSANNYTLAAEVENLTYTGVGNATFVGNASANIIDARVSGTNSLVGNAGDDTLIVDASRIGVVNGGADADTLRFVGTAGMTLGDSDFGGFTGIESYDFKGVSGNIEVSLGSIAQSKGIATLAAGTANSTLTADTNYSGNVYFTAGDGNDSLTGNSGNDTLVLGNGQGMFSGGSGNDAFLLSHANQVGPHTAGGINSILGGSGTDSLIFTVEAATLENWRFANVSGVEVIKASSLAGNLIVLGSNALASGVSTLLGGAAGGDTLSAAGYTTSNAKITIDARASTLGSTLVAGLGDPAFTGGNTLLGGNGADLIQVATAAVLNYASIVGGSGTDTVQVTTDAQVVADTDLDSLSGVEALQLANGANSISLGVKARGMATVAGGLDIITTGLGSDTLMATAVFGTTAITLDGGAGADRFAFDSAAQMAATRLVGGDGTDTLSLGQATVLGNDDAYQKVTGMEVLQAAATGESSFVLDSDAQAAGIRMVIGGAGKGTLNASAYTVDVMLDTSANANTTAGNGTTLLGGSANDSFRLLNNNVLSVSSVVGGSGSDTLTFSQDGLSISDENFTRIGGLEAVQTKDGTNYVNLGPSAAAAGLKTLVGGTGSDTIDLTNFGGDGISVQAGRGADVVSGSSTAANQIFTGDDNDLIILQNVGAVARSTVDGGGSDQTFRLTFDDYWATGNVLQLMEATALADADFANFKNVQFIVGATSGNSSFALGSNAQSAAIKGIGAGRGDDTLNLAAYSSGTGLSLYGGVGNDLIVFSTGARLGEIYTLVGGAGTDTLSFTVDALSVKDADFAKVRTTEILKTADGNNRVILGANAQAAGIVTVVGGSGKDTLDASARTSGMTLDGGAGIDSLLGGTGDDYFIVDSTSDVILDAGGIDTQATSLTNTTLVSFIENLVFTGTGNATFTGNSSANSLLGSSGSQTLVGAGGDDTLDGGSGADSLYGGAGNNFYVIDDAGDVIANETGGNDTILTKFENYTLVGGIEALALSDGIIRGTGSTSDNTITGNSIGNSLDGGAGIDTLIGGAGNDSYYVDNTGDIVDERIGSDWSADAGGTDIVYSSVTFDLWLNGGGPGSPTVDAGGGQTLSLGGARFVEGLVLTGSDNINGWGRAADATLIGNTGHNSLGAGTFNDTLDGGIGNDTLMGAGGRDSLVGGDGADSLDGGTGIDTMLGGNGDDTFVVDNVSDVTTETNSNSLTGGVDLVQSSVSYTLSENIEKLTLTGTGAVNGIGNSLENTIVGNQAYNNTSLVGGEGNDSLFGFNGDQTLDGGIGNDTLVGGGGYDVYIVDSLLDVVTEDVGGWFNFNDLVIAQVNDYTLAENVEKLTLFEGVGILNGTGNSLDNTLIGNSLDNSLDGGLNAPWLWAGDSMLGGAGNDTFFVDNIYDKVWEFAGEGTDDLVVSSASFTLGANIEKLTLTGTTAVSATGNASANTLTGNAIANSIDGGAGVDSLVGGAGNDTYFVDDSLDAIYEVFTDGTDWVVISANNYTLSSEVENLTYTGTGNATFVGNASANIIDARVSGTNSLVGGDGNDTLIVDASRVGTVNGGNDQDTLRFVGTAGMTLEDSGFGGFTAIESFSFSEVSGDIKIEIGSSAFGLNIATLAGGTANSTLTALSSYGANGVHFTAGAGSDSLTGYNGNDTLVAGTGSAKLTGGAGTDRFEFSSGTQLLANTVVGGAGDDTLALISAATLGDTQFVNVSGVEAIHASSLGAAVVLGINAQASGIASLFGGVASDSLSAAGMSSGNIYIQGTIGASTLGDTLVAGTGSNRATLVGNNGADTNKSANYFLISDASLLGNNSIIGGASSIDYLQFNGSGQTLSDSSFAQISGLDGITFKIPGAIGVGGNNTITLGATAETKFGNVISIEGGGYGNDSINLSGTTKAVYVNAYTGYYGDTITAGSNNNTLIGGARAFADDLFIFTSGSNLSGASIVGGGGTDTLRLSANGWSILDGEVFLDSDNDGVWDIGETFVDEAPNGIWDAAEVLTLDANSNGIWDAGDTFTDANSNGIWDAAEVLTSDVNSNSIWDAGDTFKDTYRANGTKDIGSQSNALNSLSDIEVLDINGGGNKIKLGTSIAKGIQTIVGGLGPNTIDAANYNSAPNALTWNMNASNGSDVLLGGANGNLFQIKNGANLQNSFITGNIGTDTIQILAGAQTLGDAVFSNISGNSIEKLVLGTSTTTIAGNSITLGTIAASKGIDTVIGGTRRDTIDATAFNSAITIDASASSGSRLIGSTANTNQNTLIGGSAGGNEFVLGAISANSLVGGSNGLDTLTLISDGVTLVDGNFTPISKIGTLKLEGGYNIATSKGNTVTLGTNALIAGIRTLVGGEGDNYGIGDQINTSAYGSAGVLFQVTDQDYLGNIIGITGGTGIDTLKFSRDGVSVTDENVAKLTNIDVIQTANGTNRFLMHDAFDNAGIDSIIGGTGSNIINMMSTFYDPLNNGVNFDDVITFDMSAGSYSLIVGDDELRYAKVVGGNSGGSVSITNVNGVVNDIQFENLYDANINSVTYVGNIITLGENAMASGMKTLGIAGCDAYVSDFNAPLVVNTAGVNTSERVFTSFAALANLTFNSNSGTDTLVIEDSDARAITSLKGDFDVLVLGDGKNYVKLANDAGLSMIVGGAGADTIDMVFNTTGINFLINSSVMGDTDADAEIYGGTGRDTISVNFGSTGNTFLDTQLDRVRLALGSIRDSFSTDTLGGNDYIFDANFVNNGIDEVYVHDNDYIDATNVNRNLNFIFVEPVDFSTVVIDGTAGNDTLSLNIATPSTVTIVDTDFALQVDVDLLVLNSVHGREHANFEVELGADAEAAGISTVIGGNGGDSLDASGMAQSVTLSGGLNVRLATDNATSHSILQDTLVGGSGDDSLYGDNFYDSLVGGNGADTLTGASSTAKGANEIDTLTGGAGNDWFILGDGNNAYYNTADGKNDFALITDFAEGDVIQLKNLSSLYSPVNPIAASAIYNFGYVEGSTNIFNVSVAGVDRFIYADADKNGVISSGDNLIAAIDTTLPGGLNLQSSTRFTFV